MESAGSLIIFFAAVFAVSSRDTLSPGLVGLTITYALQITYAFSYLVRTVCDVEANIVAVERLKEYSNAPQVNYIKFNDMFPRIDIYVHIDCIIFYVFFILLLTGSFLEISFPKTTEHVASVWLN